MRALLDDAALVHHQDAVAGQHGREPVRDHERGAMAHQLFQRGLHQRLAFGIERRGRFVQQQQRRIAQDRARDRDALALAAGQRHAALAERRVEAARQAADEFGGMRKLGGALDLGIGGIGPAEADVVARAGREHHRVLRHQRDARCARRADRPSRTGTPSSEIVPDGRIVEAQQQMKQRALAGAGRTDDRDLLAGLHGQRDAVERGHVRPRRIGEADVVEADLAARRRRQRDAARRAR